MKITFQRPASHVLAAIFLALLGVNAPQAQTINGAEGQVMVARGALLVDVRTPQEFSAGHVEGAINIPHTDVESRASEFGENKDREIVLYCRSGHRSGLAQESLKALGYTKVFNAGAFQDWPLSGG
ncbi:MAG: rhodanese-like domain-containing protein [Gammaproteobacteria bacterium]|nr:rhodanese-like domain-containing protein [Gammaproteobacteria bacterium]